jgi:hypothetical protein
MGLRDKLRNRLKNTVNKLSGEYSAPAPEELTPYERPGTPLEEVEIVRPRKTRPSGAKSKKPAKE